MGKRCKTSFVGVYPFIRGPSGLCRPSRNTVHLRTGVPTLSGSRSGPTFWNACKWRSWEARLGQIYESPRAIRLDCGA